MARDVWREERGASREAVVPPLSLQRVAPLGNVFALGLLLVCAVGNGITLARWPSLATMLLSLEW